MLSQNPPFTKPLLFGFRKSAHFRWILPCAQSGQVPQSSCESGRLAQNGKRAEIQKWEEIGQKIENGPRPEMGKKWRKNGIWGHFSIFSPFLGHFFPISGRGPFLFFSQFLPIFGFRPIFHSIPGGLTRNQSSSKGNLSVRVQVGGVPSMVEEDVQYGSDNVQAREKHINTYFLAPLPLGRPQGCPRDRQTRANGGRKS